MVEDTLLVIDATGEAGAARSALQEVMAAHLSAALQEVQAAWVAVDLVGGIEKVTPPLVEEQCSSLAVRVRLKKGRGLRGLAPVLLFREAGEGTPVAGNCAFTSCVQTLTGNPPRVIAVSNTGKGAWRVEVDFPSPAVLLAGWHAMTGFGAPGLAVEWDALPALLLTDVVAVQPTPGGGYTCVNCARQRGLLQADPPARRLARGEVIRPPEAFDCEWCQYWLAQIVPDGAPVELPWKSAASFDAGVDRLCYLDRRGAGCTRADFLAQFPHDLEAARRCFDLADGQSLAELAALARGAGK